MIAVRPIRSGECGALHEMVRVLAEAHAASADFKSTPEALARAIFAEHAIVGCLVAEVAGELAGCAIWHRSYSTFRGAEVMYLEDLAVLPQYRRRGVARALLAGVARLACDRGYPGIYWLMMAWNAGARGLYESVGAEIETGTCFCRLHGEALRRLAA
jgi:GNAT superfamily N-acetyltransferase